MAFKKRIVSTFYVLFVIAALLFVIGRGHFLIGSIFNLCRPLLFLVGLSLLFLLRNSKPKQVVLFILLLLVAETLSKNIFHERLKKVKDDEVSVKLMSYNIFFRNTSPNSSIQLIKDARPDILFLQELTPKLTGQLNASIGREYPYQSLLPLNGTHGIGIYSKYKITSTDYLKKSNNLPYAQIVTLDISGKKVRAINTHLNSPAVAVENKDQFFKLYEENYKQRHRQIEQINSIISDNSNAKAILIGDLNMPKFEPLYSKVRRNWVDLFSKKGVGQRANFPNSLKTKPLIPLDYIFLKGEVETVKMEVVKGGGSDHLAVTGTVNF